MKPGDAQACRTAPTPIGEHHLWRAFARSVLFNLQAEMVANLIRVGGVIFLARALEARDLWPFAAGVLGGQTLVILSPLRPSGDSA